MVEDFINEKMPPRDCFPSLHIQYVAKFLYLRITNTPPIRSTSNSSPLDGNCIQQCLNQSLLTFWWANKSTKVLIHFSSSHYFHWKFPHNIQKWSLIEICVRVGISGIPSRLLSPPIFSHWSSAAEMPVILFFVSFWGYGGEDWLKMIWRSDKLTLHSLYFAPLLRPQPQLSDTTAMRIAFGLSVFFNLSFWGLLWLYFLF